MRSITNSPNGREKMHCCFKTWCIPSTPNKNIRHKYDLLALTKDKLNHHIDTQKDTRKQVKEDPATVYEKN